jgi:protein SCO1/2
LNTLRKKPSALGAAALLACAAALAQAQIASAHGDVPHAAQSSTESAPAPKVNRWGANYFPNVELTTHEGKTVKLYDDLLKGKSVAINLMFTECKDVCPLETATMVQLQQQLGSRMGKDMFFYSISIDPKNDTPKVLKAYAEKYGAGPGWLFLTGKPEDIKLVSQKVGLARGRDAENRDGHGSILMVGNEPTGQWIRNSALENPRFLATRIGSFLGWKDNQQASKSYAEARAPVFENGQYVFQSRCSACHTIGQGDRVGPDLSGVTVRRERAWLTRYIQNPDQLLAAGDPVATALFKKFKEVRMPNLALPPEEVNAVIAYIASRTPAKEAVQARR